MSATVSTSGFVLPIGGVSAGGEWNFQVQVGDRGSEILEKLHHQYAATWYHGVSPSGSLVLKSPADMPSTSSLTLYRSIEDAIAAGVSAAVAPYRVYRSLKKDVLEPEANEVWVTGYDFRTGRPIQIYKDDSASIDPTTAPGSRPPNWLGWRRKYAWVDGSLTTLAACRYCINLLFDRLTVARELCEFDCEYLDGKFKGDLITLDKAIGYSPTSNTGTAAIVRLKTFRGDFIQVGTQAAVWRPSHYVAEITNTNVSTLGVPGTDLASIKSAWATKIMSKFRVDPSAATAAKRPLINVQPA